MLKRDCKVWYKMPRTFSDFLEPKLVSKIPNRNDRIAFNYI